MDIINYDHLNRLDQILDRLSDLYNHLTFQQEQYDIYQAPVEQTTLELLETVAYQQQQTNVALYLQLTAMGLAVGLLVFILIGTSWRS